MTFGLVLFIAFVIFSAIIGIAGRVGERRRLAESGIAEIDGMDGITFEHYLEVLFGNLSYSVQRTHATGDFGADLIIKKVV